jgi:hypothetical protein
MLECSLSWHDLLKCSANMYSEHMVNLVKEHFLFQSYLCTKMQSWISKQGLLKNCQNKSDLIQTTLNGFFILVFFLQVTDG